MSIDKPTHKDLVEECCFYEGFYSLSFRDRIMYDLGYVKITFSTYSKELDALLDGELEERINSIKKPWWNGIYYKILEDNKGILFVLFLVLYMVDFICCILRNLCRMLSKLVNKHSFSRNQEK